MDPAAAASATQAAQTYNPMVGQGNVFGMQALNVNNIFNVKDSRWLQLEVCREFQRNKCIRPDTECKFAHPPSTVEVQNGRVTACYDSIKGRCNREKPPCKYFHPPQHLKDQLLINGRNHLALKNAFMTQLQAGVTPGSQFVHSSVPIQQGSYLATGLSPVTNFNPYIAASSPMMTVGLNDAVGSPITGVVPQQAFPNMAVSFKRPAPEKSGVPVYPATGNAAYHQAALMQQLGGQTYFSVPCEYGGTTASGSAAGVLALSAPPPNAADAAAGAVATSLHPSSVAAANHIVAISSSSSQSDSSSVISSSHTTSTSSISSTKASTPTSSSSSMGKVGAAGAHLNAAAGNAVVVSSVPPSLSGPPVNMLNYAAGYSLNKGLRPSLKTPTLIQPHPVAAAAVGLPPGATATPSAAAAATIPTGAVGGIGYNAFHQVPSSVGIPITAANNVPIMAQSGVAGGIPLTAFSVPGMTGMPMMHPQLVYSQYPASSLTLPQFSALSNNPQYTWAPGTEQPFKKLKTS